MLLDCVLRGILSVCKGLLSDCVNVLTLCGVLCPNVYRLNRYTPSEKRQTFQVVTG